jgi:UDP-N-acetylmuramoyl-L-alanyl-D-glutamate--2,6-diaminopimelate ligase
LNGITKVNQVTYGRSSEAHWRAKEVEHTIAGLNFIAEGLDVRHTRLRVPVSTNLVGGFNTSNCLAAVTLGLGVMDLEPEAVQAGILTLPGIPGRMERFELGQDYLAFVDFAHTPNALRRALEAARQLTSRRVIAVFGSAGLRDRTKRRLMAQASVELADLTVLTAEDPRTESLAEILAEMAAGAEARGGEEGENFWRVVDRGEAIRFALNLARPGDLVIVCGKGHEQSMCFGEIEYPWDDRIAMRSALAESLGVEGPEMPYLPTQDDQSLPED